MNYQLVIEELKVSPESAYNKLYKGLYPSILKYVVNNNGSEEDAKDVFQETMLLLHKKVADDKLQLTAGLNTYLFAVSKNLWLNKLRERKREVRAVSAEIVPPAEEDIINEETRTDLLQRLGRAMRKMTGHCLSLLQALFFRKKGITAIVEEEHYKNAHTARNQKYKCLEQARKEFEK